MSQELSREKMEKLFEKIQKNSGLALKLGLVEGSSKEKKNYSPIKSKKVVVSSENKKSKKSILQENAQETEAFTSKSFPNNPEIEMEDEDENSWVWREDGKTIRKNPENPGLALKLGLVEGSSKKITVLLN